jgi:hypothetical protein
MINWIDSLSDPAANLVGSALGIFGGLTAILIGAFVNAELNRRRDDRLKREEAIRIATALKTELSSIRDALLNNAEIMRKPTDSDSLTGPDIPHLIYVYPKLISRLPLLSENVIKETIEIYMMMEQYSDNLQLLGGKLHEIKPGRFQMILPTSVAKVVSVLNDKYARDIQVAINALQKFID